MQGKLGLSNLGQIVADLLKKVGYDSNMVDITRLTDIVNGFVVTNRQTVRACLEQLAAAYFFDCVESDGLLKFVKRGKVSGTTVDYATVNLPIVLTDQEAKVVADVSLCNVWVDALNGTVRPVIAYAFFVLLCHGEIYLLRRAARGGSTVRCRV